MNADDKKEITELFTGLFNVLRVEKESTTNKAALSSLQDSIEAGKKSNKIALKPECFTGSTEEDANQWLDFYERIATINNWTVELQLHAFPLYLKAVAGSWFLTLAEDIKTDLARLKTAFKERFAAGPHNWILSQQLGTRKQRPDEPLDAYVADIIRPCKRLCLADADSMRYFIEGLQSDLQVYVALQRPKTLQEAESFARMKHTINQRQGLSDNTSAITQVTTLLSRLSDKLSDSTASPALAAIANPLPPPEDNRFHLLSKQIQ